MPRLIRYLFSRLALAAAASSCASRGENASTLASSGNPLFREVSFQPFDAIALGQPLPAHAPPTSELSPYRLVLASPAGDADSIYVSLDNSRRVSALAFIYPRTKGFDERSTSYQASLGQPLRHTLADSGGGRVEHVVWEDEHTVFELSRYASADTPVRMWSALTDRVSSR